MKSKIIVALLLVFLAIISVACKKTEEEDKDKIRDLEFTVMEESNLPEIVLAKIESEKIAPFKFSYSDGEYIYIAIGYGEQETSDFSIQVNKLYESEAYIVISTTLMGPKEADAAITTPTYPFIVIKTEDLKKAVCFK